MKLTKQKLKQLIYESMNEVYKLSPEDERRRQELNIDPKTTTMDAGIAQNLRRAYGLQEPQQIDFERFILQDYQRLLRADPRGKEMIKQFQSGTDKVTTYHSIIYGSQAVKSGKVDVSKGNPFTKWIKKFGKNNKDSISAFSVTNKPGFLPYGASNENSQAFTGLGFLMKGYPVFVSENDLMSQTLGKIPKGLEQHQKNSGIAKRTDDYKSGLYGLNWDVANEVILDNWGLVAAYVHEDMFTIQKANIMTIPLAINILKDGIDTGLPFYTFHDYGSSLIQTKEDMEMVLGRTAHKYHNSSSGPFYGDVIDAELAKISI